MAADVSTRFLKFILSFNSEPNPSIGTYLENTQKETNPTKDHEHPMPQSLPLSRITASDHRLPKWVPSIRILSPLRHRFQPVGIRRRSSNSVGSWRIEG
ncbi:hypothetical protein MRB53_010250 [Persea americana]|uniref:Uncharacterized protein n=1 Tax=Persea americana TaxID=3435 RepID=A0ACC2LS38_PERAE|nr:hypothetical protein MRB53_010250 [Persea americana]